MRGTRFWSAGAAAVVGTAVILGACSSGANPGSKAPAAKAEPLPDAVEEAQTPRLVRADRPEQKKTEHDKSDAFDPTKAPKSSTALETQPEKGEVRGFDFSRDPLNAK